MPSHRTPRPPRGAPLYLGQPRRIPPTGQEHVNQLGRPPAQLPAHPTRHVEPAARAHVPDPNTVEVVNRTVPVNVLTWDQFSERRRASWNEEAGGLEAGDCYFGSYHGVDPNNMVAFWLALPTADGGVSSACIDIIPPNGNPPPKERPRWTWNGNEQRPTLTPSIRHSSIEHGDYWHGFLTDGVLVGCKNERKPK